MLAFILWTVYKIKGWPLALGFGGIGWDSGHFPAPSVTKLLPVSQLQLTHV